MFTRVEVEFPCVYVRVSLRFMLPLEADIIEHVMNICQRWAKTNRRLLLSYMIVKL